MPTERTPSHSFEGLHCTLTIERPAPGVVLIAISGRDGGELGDAPFRALAADLQAAPLQLFIDARATQGAAVAVSHDWAQWLQRNRPSLTSIHMLTGSKFIQLTADFVRRFAQLGDLMHIYTDPSAFQEALTEAQSGPATP
jgi:hypothetical protein